MGEHRRPSQALSHSSEAAIPPLHTRSRRPARQYVPTPGRLRCRVRAIGAACLREVRVRLSLSQVFVTKVRQTAAVGLIISHVRGRRFRKLVQERSRMHRLSSQLKHEMTDMLKLITEMTQLVMRGRLTDENAPEDLKELRTIAEGIEVSEMDQREMRRMDQPKSKSLNTAVLWDCFARFTEVYGKLLARTVQQAARLDARKRKALEVQDERLKKQFEHAKQQKLQVGRFHRSAAAAACCTVLRTWCTLCCNVLYCVANMVHTVLQHVVLCCNMRAAGRSFGSHCLGCAKESQLSI